eukprot:scaffold66960_cov24-Cyclotella_meneghiniana.AAC.1
MSDQLFAPVKEECPICEFTMPCDENEGTAYMACCGKFICNGCVYSLGIALRNSGSDCCRCPFCRAPSCVDEKETIRRISERIEKYNDPQAMANLGYYYKTGFYGLEVDHSKAVELCKRASALGSVKGHFHLGVSYHEGTGVEQNKKKAVHHWQIAAMMGNIQARYNLGCAEVYNGNIQRGTRQFMVAAKSGLKVSLDAVMEYFKQGYVTKEDFEKTLRGYQDALEETKTEQRDRAAAIVRAARQNE